MNDMMTENPSTVYQANAADVNQLRRITGAGMMDCKKALVEANGDFEEAIVLLRKKGMKVSANRSDKDAKEGVVIAKTNESHTKGIIIEINCETDFVAKNEEFLKFADSIASVTVLNNPSSIDEIKPLLVDKLPVSEVINAQMGKIGEKVEISKYEIINAEYVISYIHAGNKLAVLVAFNKQINSERGRDIAMQIAAMNPVAVDKNDVPKSVIEREIEIGKDQARKEGKPEQLLEKIAVGKLNKYYKDNTLVNQDFVKDNSKTILQVLAEIDLHLKVVSFKRVNLG